MVAFISNGQIPRRFSKTLPFSWKKGRAVTAQVLRPCENVSYAICEQQRRRSACASAQSDQRLCCSLPRQNDTFCLYIRNFKILAGLCSWAGQFMSCLVGDSRRHIVSWRVSYASQTITESWWIRVICLAAEPALIETFTCIKRYVFVSRIWLFFIFLTVEGSLIQFYLKKKNSSRAFIGAGANVVILWAATWQNQQSVCAPSEDSDQSGHPPRLIRVFAMRLMGS